MPLLPTTETTVPELGGNARVIGGFDGAEHAAEARLVSAKVAVFTRTTDDGLKTMVGSRYKEGWRMEAMGALVSKPPMTARRMGKSGLHAYNLQDAGHDTVDANLMLGHGADERSYALASCILEDLGINSVRLITNNPDKINALEADGIKVNERVALPCTLHPENSRYLKTKAERMNHLLRVAKPSAQNADSDFIESQTAD